MSSDSAVSILEQIIGTAATPAFSNSSARSLNSASPATSYYHNTRQRGTAGNSRENNSMKAIVLSSVSDVPSAPARPNLTSPSSTPTSTPSGGWWNSILRNATGADRDSGTPTGAVTWATMATDFPMYYIWILPDSLNNGTVKPSVVDGRVSNIIRFPVCSVKDNLITDILLPGSIIRIDYEDRSVKRDAYVISVINNDEEFGRAIFLELEGLTAAELEFAACNGQNPAVSHPRGDTIGAGADLLPVSAVTPFGLRHGNKNDEENWEGIEIHYTVTQNAADAISVLGRRGLSYHYLIDKDGTRTMLIDPDYIAWHGGSDNSRFIGISLVNLGNDIASINLPDATPAEDWVQLETGQYGTWEPYTAAQESSLVALVSELKTKYPAITYINGHEDNEAQKYDPGPLFNWNLSFGLTRGPKAASTKNRS